MYTVLLTGGIGSGKSTIAEKFRALGIEVIDADEVSRELVRPGQPALAQIVQCFGEAYLKENGELNRKKMRQKIFTDIKAKLALEAIMHPAIRGLVLRKLSKVTSPYAIIMIPLFAESHYQYPYHNLLVVDVPEETQIERVMSRDNSTEEDVLLILRQQSPRHIRLRVADEVIDNTGTLKALDDRIKALHEKYLANAQI